MSYINADTPVFVWFHDPRYGRIWLAGAENVRNNLGTLILKPLLTDDPHEAVSYPYQLALVMKRRFDTERYLNPSLYETKFSLTAGNSSEEIAGGSTPSSTSDSRVITPCKGLLVRPYNPRGWCVHLVRDGAQLESVKGETVEETADKVIERNLFQYAEKAPAPPPPEPPRTQQAPSYRRRPGSI